MRWFGPFQADGNPIILWWHPIGPSSALAVFISLGANLFMVAL